MPKQKKELSFYLNNFENYLNFFQFALKEKKINGDQVSDKLTNIWYDVIKKNFFVCRNKINKLSPVDKEKLKVDIEKFETLKTLLKNISGKFDIEQQFINSKEEEKKNDNISEYIVANSSFSDFYSNEFFKNFVLTLSFETKNYIISEEKTELFNLIISFEHANCKELPELLIKTLSFDYYNFLELSEIVRLINIFVNRVEELLENYGKIANLELKNKFTKKENKLKKTRIKNEINKIFIPLRDHLTFWKDYFIKTKELLIKSLESFDHVTICVEIIKKELEPCVLLLKQQLQQQTVLASSKTHNSNFPFASSF